MSGPRFCANYQGISSSQVVLHSRGAIRFSYVIADQHRSSTLQGFEYRRNEGRPYPFAFIHFVDDAEFFLPLGVSCTISSNMNHPFFIGGYYRDRQQGYEVVDMSAQSMTVKYDDGTVEKLGSDSIRIKARIYDNMLSEFRISHPLTTDEYFWSLGYLAGHSRFEAELPNQAINSFLEQYRRLSGGRRPRQGIRM